MTTIELKNFKISTYRQGDDKAAKVALVLPGYLDSKDYTHMRSHVEFLATQGYFAMSIDPPGTWESDEDISKYSIPNYLAAISELIEYLDRPTLLMGHSLGGFMASLIAPGNARVEGLVAMMCPHVYMRDQNKASFERWQREGVRVSQRDLPQVAGQFRSFRVPYAFAASSVGYESLKGLETFTGPKLFIAGSHDTTITPEMMKELFDASAEPKQLAILNSDHDYRHDQHAIDQVNSLVGEFLKRLS
jgi:pimeloyl-ACP methyl ester carboxylesterase